MLVRIKPEAELEGEGRRTMLKRILALIVALARRNVYTLQRNELTLMSTLNPAELPSVQDTSKIQHSFMARLAIGLDLLL
jgi:hypothetical protein